MPGRHILVNMRFACKKSGKYSLSKRAEARDFSLGKTIRKYETNLLKKNFKDLENYQKREKLAENGEKSEKTNEKEKTKIHSLVKKVKFHLQFR